jgi:hypothetical protein
MDIQITDPQAIGKALSKKNLSTMRDCIAAHKEAMSMHEKAVQKMQDLVDEHETAMAAIVKITP